MIEAATPRKNPFTYGKTVNQLKEIRDSLIAEYKELQTDWEEEQEAQDWGDRDMPRWGEQHEHSESLQRANSISAQIHAIDYELDRRERAQSNRGRLLASRRDAGRMW